MIHLKLMVLASAILPAALACAAPAPPAAPERDAAGEAQSRYGGSIRLATEEDTNDYDPSTQASGASWTSLFAHAKHRLGSGARHQSRKRPENLTQSQRLSRSKQG